jgi:hypothetical protein
MGFLKWLFCEKDSDKVGEEDDEEYEVCEEHGHDLRDYEDDRFESKTLTVDMTFPIWRGIVTGAVPGRFIGLQILLKRQTAPCRDCSHEEERYRGVETRVIYKEDGEVQSMSKDSYGRKVEEYEDQPG